MRNLFRDLSSDTPPLNDLGASAVARQYRAHRCKAETLIGRLTKQLETEHTGQANGGAWLENGRKWVRELELENESIKKQLVENNTKTAKAKQQVEHLLAVMAGNYKKA